jgi:hypothetical protein
MFIGPDNPAEPHTPDAIPGTERPPKPQAAVSAETSAAEPALPDGAGPAAGPTVPPLEAAPEAAPGPDDAGAGEVHWLEAEGRGRAWPEPAVPDVLPVSAAGEEAEPEGAGAGAAVPDGEPVGDGAGGVTEGAVGVGLGVEVAVAVAVAVGVGEGDGDCNGDSVGAGVSDGSGSAVSAAAAQASRSATPETLALSPVVAEVPLSGPTGRSGVRALDAGTPADMTSTAPSAAAAVPRRRPPWKPVSVRKLSDF